MENLFSEANSYYKKKDYDKAISLYKKAIEELDNKVSSLYNMSICYIKQRKFEEAIPCLVQALKERRDSNYCFNLGFCYAEIKDYKKAYVYFNEAWALNSEDDDCEKAIKIIENKIGWNS